MIIDDLLWLEDASPRGLPEGYPGALEKEFWLREVEPYEVRLVGVTGRVGILFDMRSALYPSDEWGVDVDVGVLVVYGVNQCRYSVIRNPLLEWKVTRSDKTWQCHMGLLYQGDAIDVSGVCASLYFGRVPGFPDRQPGLWEATTPEIRAGWPAWGAEFELTVEPQHSHPELLKKPENSRPSTDIVVRHRSDIVARHS